jgi:DNA relaxase NicK
MSASGRSRQVLPAYEKGLELAGKVAGTVVTAIDGHPVEDIYRCEVELKAESRPILWEVVERRDQYFAGSYPSAPMSCQALRRTSS